MGRRFDPCRGLHTLFNESTHLSLRLNQVTHERSLAYKAEIEASLKFGHPRIGIPGKVTGAINLAAVALKVDRRHLTKWVNLHSNDEYTPDWSLYKGPNVAYNDPKYDPKATVLVNPESVYDAPKVTFPGKRIFIITGAQDDTDVHMPFWNNLQAYARHLGAEIIVGGFTYQKGLFEDHAVATASFREPVRPYLNGNVVDLGPNIIFNGRANIVPTSPDPLVGWETNSRKKWMIIPHAKIALKSVNVMSGAARKQIMSTGVVTLPNYVQRNAGQRAEFHHTIGATIVEIGLRGDHYCRQIHAKSDGSFQDLTICVENETLTFNNRVEAIVWGDIHRYVLDPEVAMGAWGFDVDIDQCVSPKSMIDILKPKHQFFHDSFDFYSRSHHTRENPYERQKRLLHAIDSVEYEIKQAGDFLAVVRRHFCQSVHVASNHNLHFDKWIEDRRALDDTVNAIYWCEMRALWLRAGRANIPNFILHAEALKLTQKDRLADVIFLKEGQSYKVAGDLESGLHGHKGPSGSHGSVVNLSKMVERVNIADKHQPAIREGLYCAGTSSKLELDYNQSGPGAWDHSHIVVYPNSKRSIITMNGPNWHANG